MERSAELIRATLSDIDGTAVERLVDFFNDQEAPSIEPALHFSPIHEPRLYATLIEALGRLTTEDMVRDVSFSPCPNCDAPNKIGSKVCVICKVDYDDYDVIPKDRIIFQKTSPEPRNVRWMILIHGMNTRGGWQELFGWRISRTYGYAIPISMFKYGIFRIGALFDFRISTMTDNFERHLTEIYGEVAKDGLGPPDVIAHSMGTLILSKLLERKNPDLIFSRIILCGSIVRQDYDWNSHIGKHCDAILNDVGEKDIYPRIAKYFIPGAGPSGAHGFLDKAVINIKSSSYGHSDFFTPGNLAQTLERLGTWRNFLISGEPGEAFAATKFNPTSKNKFPLFNIVSRNIFKTFLGAILAYAVYSLFICLFQ